MIGVALRSWWAAPSGSRPGRRSANPSIEIAVVKKSGLPGTICSGASTYGTIDSVGSTAQPLRPPRASEAAIKRKKSRRLDGSSPAPPES